MIFDENPGSAGSTLKARGATAESGGKEGGAGINGTVTIRGGTITATGGAGYNDGASGIGIDGTGVVTILGGVVEANGGAGSTTVLGSSGAAGIVGTDGVKILGGVVTASGGAGGRNGPGVTGHNGGNGIGGTGGVHISGGVVKATGGAGGTGTTSSGNNGWDITGSSVIITGGSVEARATMVNTPTYDGSNQVAPYSTFPVSYIASDAGKTFSFHVPNPPAGAAYDYKFTVPVDGKAYLWLPTGANAPSTLPDLSLALTATPSIAQATLSVTATPAGVTAYDFFKLEANGTYASIATNKASPYTWTSLTGGTTYACYATATVTGTSGAPDVTVYSNTATVTPTAPSPAPGPGPDPGPGGDTQSLSTLLSALNTALSPKASVSGLSSIPAAVGTPITQATAGNATFAKKDAPGTALPGYTVLAPSFSSSVTLNGGTTGNTLALKYTINVATLAGFENWASLTDAQRAALLDSLKVIFAYEYADKTWKTLVGAGGIISWANALAKKIVSFTPTGISLNYAVTDATGDPSANGSVLVIPDGAKDGKIIDPVWLMKGAADPVVLPTSVDLTPKAAAVETGRTVSIAATVYPANATDKSLVWTSSDPSVATVTASGSVATVTGVKAGTATITATAASDATVKATATVAVTAAGTGGSSSSGCDAGAFGAFGLALCGVYLWRKRG